MKKLFNCIGIAFLAALLLCGCSVTTVDDMYYLPKRSDSYLNLQSVIDRAMSGMEYAAPTVGENQQNVQAADLNGDGEPEYLVYARGTEEKPLRILVFRQMEDSYVHLATVACNGSIFDQVEYVDLDGLGGVEIVVGRRLSDQVIRTATVYTLSENEVIPMVSVNYSKLLTVDLDDNGRSELFVLRPGASDADNGLAELYAVKDGTMQLSNVTMMSQPVDKLKRVIVGTLHGGNPAVFTACTVDDTAIITDVYAMANGSFTNVALTNESGTSIQTMRNYYVYADDIDNDAVVELPELMNMKPLEGQSSGDRHHLIRWYAMTTKGDEVTKMYTFHNFADGWYIQLDSRWAPHLTVQIVGNEYQFYVWDQFYKNSSLVFTIQVHTGQNWQDETPAGSFVLYKTDTAVYTATLEAASEGLSLTKDVLSYSFRLIQQDWKTGET